MNKEKYYKYSFSIIMAVYNVEEYLEEAIEASSIRISDFWILLK